MRIVTRNTSVGVGIWANTVAADDRLIGSCRRNDSEGTNHTNGYGVATMATSPSGRVYSTCESASSVVGNVRGISGAAAGKRNRTTVVSTYLKIHAADVLNY